MGKIAWFSVVVIGMGVAACGDDGGSNTDAGSIQLTDGGGIDAAPTVACNPVAQTGCMPDEKCATLVESDEPFLARTACVPDGDVVLGGDCVQGEAGPTTGFDDCEGGGECRVGICTEICQQAPNSCSDGVCVLISTKFQDLEGIGLCAAPCDPINQDCVDSATDNACYLNLSNGESACSRVPEETMGITQGQDCYGPEAGSCYLNGCPEGFGAVLPKTPGGDDGNVCAAFCDPVAQDSTNATALGGDPNGITCASRGAISSHCRFISTFYSDTGHVDNAYGMCLDPELWRSCENYILGSNDPEDQVFGCEPFQAMSTPNPAGVEAPTYQGDWAALPE